MLSKPTSKCFTKTYSSPPFLRVLIVFLSLYIHYRSISGDPLNVRGISPGLRQLSQACSIFLCTVSAPLDHENKISERNRFAFFLS